MALGTREQMLIEQSWTDEGPPFAPASEGGGFTIAQLADEFGVTLRTLRFYESRGFLAPAAPARRGATAAATATGSH
jgi:MerR family regulatory protein